MVLNHKSSLQLHNSVKVQVALLAECRQLEQKAGYDHCTNLKVLISVFQFHFCVTILRILIHSTGRN